jgi:hypothetical protein
MVMAANGVHNDASLKAWAQNKRSPGAVDAPGDSWLALSRPGRLAMQRLEMVVEWQLDSFGSVVERRAMRSCPFLIRPTFCSFSRAARCVVCG